MNKKQMLAAVISMQSALTACDYQKDESKGEIVQAPGEMLDDHGRKHVGNLIDQEKLLRPFVRQMIERSDTLFDAYGRSIDNNYELIADLEERGNRLDWYFENGQFRQGGLDPSINASFHEGQKAGYKDDYIVFETNPSDLGTGTIMHEAFHSEVGHSDEMKAYSNSGGEWGYGKELGSLIITQKDPAFLIGSLYRIAEAPLRPLWRLQDEELSPEGEQYILAHQDLSATELADLWTEAAFDSNSAVELFGLTQAELHSIYATEAFYELHQETLVELSAEWGLELNRELKQESRSERYLDKDAVADVTSKDEMESESVVTKDGELPTRSERNSTSTNTRAMKRTGRKPSEAKKQARKEKREATLEGIKKTVRVVKDAIETGRKGGSSRR